jgi:hypothetical protein
MATGIIKDSNILSAEPLFPGTRVPFKVLIDYWGGGDTLNHFLEQSSSRLPLLRELTWLHCFPACAAAIEKIRPGEIVLVAGSA